MAYKLRPYTSVGIRILELLMYSSVAMSTISTVNDSGLAAYIVGLQILELFVYASALRPTVSEPTISHPRIWGLQLSVYGF